MEEPERVCLRPSCAAVELYRAGETPKTLGSGLPVGDLVEPAGQSLSLDGFLFHVGNVSKEPYYPTV